MARPRVILNTAGVRALLTAPGVEAELRRRMGPVLAAAQANAPRKSGDYAASLRLWTERHTGRSSRVAAHVGTDIDYGLEVEGRTGNLNRAFDAAGGGE